MRQILLYLFINVMILYIQGFLALLFILSGDIKSLIDFCSFVSWIFYGLAMVALMVMRRTKKHVKRTYKVLTN
jgi:L-type amino acid transporter 9